VELYIHSPTMPSWCGAQLKKSTGMTLPLHCLQSPPETITLQAVQLLQLFVKCLLAPFPFIVHTEI